MANISAFGYNALDGNPIEGNPSWNAVFGDNLYFEFEIDGVIYVTDITGEILITFNP